MPTPSDIPGSPQSFDPPGGRDFSILSSDQIKEAAENVLKQQPQQVQEAVEKGKSFYRRNRTVIIAGVTVVVAFKINKRMVHRAAVKASASTAKDLLKSVPGLAPNGTAYPTMMDVVNDLRATPEMAYIDHSGKLMHLLRDPNIIVTLVGDYAGKTPDEIWDYAGRLLDGSKSLKLKALK